MKHVTHYISFSFFPFFLLFFFFPHHVAYRILAPGPGIEPMPPAVDAQSRNHWTPREVPELHFLIATEQYERPLNFSSGEYCNCTGNRFPPTHIHAPVAFTEEPGFGLEVKVKEWVRLRKKSQVSKDILKGRNKSTRNREGGRKERRKERTSCYDRLEENICSMMPRINTI